MASTMRLSRILDARIARMKQAILPVLVARPPTSSTYAQFLVESRRVFLMFRHMEEPRGAQIEAIDAELEATDIRPPLPPTIPEGPGERYATLLSTLVSGKRTAELACHMYTFYAANAAFAPLVRFRADRALEHARGLVDVDDPTIIDVVVAEADRAYANTYLVMALLENERTTAASDSPGARR